jgi:hypothetical protein
MSLVGTFLPDALIRMNVGLQLELTLEGKAYPRRPQPAIHKTM